MPGTIYEAIAAARLEIPTFTKDNTADTGKYKYSYVDLTTLTRTLLPILHKHNLMMMQTTAIVEGKFVLRTSLFQLDGDGVVEGDYLISAVDMNNPQQVGSAVTY